MNPAIRNDGPVKRRDLIFRVFVSSTFSDMAAERNALHADVFPDLRKYCLERGARFQAIDLRWGVRHEAALDQQTMPVCMRELRRSQELSPRPNFILLLGQRYGWRPLPATVSAEEFELLLARVADSIDDDRSDRSQVHRWYRRDDNAKPAEYLLLPRTGDWVDDDRWAREEEALRTILAAAAEEALLSDDERRSKWLHSATHQEVQHGALEADRPQDHVFAYFRWIDGLPKDETAAQYRDFCGTCVDTEAQSQLERLKKDLRALLPPEHIRRYTVAWEVGRPVLDKAMLKQLCDDVKCDLKGIIDQELAVFLRLPELDRERESHHEFAQKRGDMFIGQQDALKRIDDYLSCGDTTPLVLYGKSGCGKSALMARAWLNSLQGSSSPAGEGPPAIARFIGATPASCDLRLLLTGLCHELGVKNVRSDIDGVVQAFRGRLSKTPEARPSGLAEGEGEALSACQTRPTVLFLDALDQLNPADGSHMLYWLPRELPPGVKIVLSILEPESHEEAPPDPYEDTFGIAGRIWPDRMVEVGELDEGSAATLLASWLDQAGRTLRPEQARYVLDRYAACPRPLFLKLAFEEARRWPSWAPVRGAPDSEHGLGDTIEGILGDLLKRLEQPRYHGEALVGRALGYLAAARNGLTEDELLDVLSRDPDVYADFVRGAGHVPPDLTAHILKRMSTQGLEGAALDVAVAQWLDRLNGSPKELRAFMAEICALSSGPRVPVVVWSRLFGEMEPYMTRRRADGTIVMGFYHREVGLAVERRYLDESERVRAHQHLAEYFCGLDLWTESPEMQRARAERMPPTPRPANVRKVVELPYHRLEVARLAGKDDPDSPYWDAAADLLLDWRFLEAKAEADAGFCEQCTAEPSSTLPTPSRDPSASLSAEAAT